MKSRHTTLNEEESDHEKSNDQSNMMDVDQEQSRTSETGTYQVETMLE